MNFISVGWLALLSLVASNSFADNTCKYSNDGTCDDGRPGASYSLCKLGTDDTDCRHLGSPEGSSDAVVSCDNECLFSSRSKWEKKCIGFDSKTGEIRWENGIPCTPVGPFDCWDCQDSGNLGFSASYVYLKDHHYVDLPFTAFCHVGRDHPDCGSKTVLQICQERIRADSNCRKIIPRGQ